MRRALLALACSVAVITPATALAWSPLRSENPDVRRGNALMSKQEYTAALEAYDSAAEELPGSKGVQLNRGLALLAQGSTELAKEAFLAAADPSAPTHTRADAYYDLGVAYAREGDALAEQEDHERATASFREAVDAFKRSLRLRPGDRDAAWNLEYALQRIREQEEKQQQQEQEQEQQQQQEQEQQQQQEQEQEQQQQQEQEQEQQQQQEQEQDQQQQQEQEQQEQEQDQQQQQEGQGQEQQREERQGQSEERRQEPMPQDDVQRFLDALEQNEESLPLQRARRRSAGRRPPEKDW